MTNSRPASLEALLASLGPADQLRAFYEARLGALTEYDRTHGGALVQTLDAYFAAGRSLSAAARRLSTHRNTVRYRLRRFEELTGMNLRHVDDLVQIWWALRRHKLHL